MFDTVTKVLTQLVLDGLEPVQISVKLVKEQVDLHLGYSEGSLNKWHNALSSTMSEFVRVT
jgi:hypothetical protein